MDAEDIQKRLTSLGQRNFKRVIDLMLRRVLGYDAINIDASGDGGSDWLVEVQGGLRLRLAIQDTIQAKWESKALADAKKAHAELAANRYLFFTNRTHQQTTTTQLELDITNATGMSCSIFEARRISELLFLRGLTGEFLQTLGERPATDRPSMPEMCLVAYSNLSADRKNHRDEIYCDSIRLACFESPKPSSKRGIIDAVFTFLGTAESQRPLIDRQFERLVAKGDLCKSAEGLFDLSPAVRKALTESEQLYLLDWAALETAQSQLLKDVGASASWTPEDAQTATIYISRMFIQEQLELLRRARIDNLISSWTARLGNPDQQLRDLLGQRGVPIRKIPKVIQEMTDLAKDRDVIAKLTRMVTFVALEGRDPALSAVALGCRSWDEVSALIDSSVAIPFLCEEMNELARSYHFAVSGNAVRELLNLKTKCCITAGHLEECAAHLIHAYRYQPVTEDGDLAGALRLSENAFIAYFGALKAEARLGEQTLTQFLEAFSRQAASPRRGSEDIRQAARSVMPEIQELLTHYGVPPCRPERRVSLDKFGSLQKAFDLACMETGRSRHPILREHDVYALAHLARSTESEDESWMMLTWDKTFTHVAQNELTRAFVLSSDAAIDFTQPFRRLTDTQLCSLAHKLAKISSPADELAAHMLDRVARLDPEKLKDSEFRRHLLEFRDQALKSLPTDDDAKFHGWLEGQTIQFLEKENIDTPEKQPTHLPFGDSGSSTGVSAQAS
jgi:hypothetical protein